MSITPGWHEEDCFIESARTNPVFDGMIFATEKVYYLDNGGEYKMFDRTKEGWRDLCDELKTFEP